jgi:hypothetical protein
LEIHDSVHVLLESLFISLSLLLVLPDLEFFVSLFELLEVGVDLLVSVFNLLVSAFE